MTIFDECLKALGNNKILLSEKETEEVFKSFIKMFPITKWGVIDWAMVSNKYIVDNLDDIIRIIQTRIPNTDNQIYILWNDESLPSIRVDLKDVLYVIDDVTAVSFDTWLYNSESMYVIEFHHEGRINIGFV